MFSLLSILAAGCGPTSGPGNSNRPDDTDPIDSGGDDMGDDTGTGPVDADGDGYYDCVTSAQAQYEDIICGDCNDNDATVYPTADETTQNGVDNDCDSSIDEDYVEPSVCYGVTGLSFTLGAIFSGDLEAQTITYEGDDLPTEFIGEQAGATAIVGGDVTGDGIDDLVVGSRYWGLPLTGDLDADLANSSLGRVYIVEGGSAVFESGVEALLSEAAATTISGSMFDLNLGTGLSLADPDEDGIYDIFAGAPGYNNAEAYEWVDPPQGDGSGTGAIFRYSGKTDWVADYDYSVADATIVGAENEGIGGIAKGIGDIDGDGKPDLLDYNNQVLCDVLTLEDFSGTRAKSKLLSHQISGGYADSSFCGAYGVASGDLNGDEVRDLLIGDSSSSANASAGNGWVIFGDSSLPSTIDLPTTDESNPDIDYLTWSGDGVSYYAGSILTVGDLDGDRKDDIAFGAYGEDNDHMNSGAAHLLFGGDVTESWNDSTLQNGDDITLGYTGPTATSVFDLNDFSNSKSAFGDVEDAKISFAGLDIVSDFECPGVSAIVIGAANYGGGTDGKAFVVNYATLLDKGTTEFIVNEADNQVLEGAPDSEFGFRVFARKPDGSSFDFNADGFPDVVVSARSYDSSRGAVYVFLGERT
ncbi:MAG: putative metal-binding motif-containing protein [Deltaproteobacteria bacterium]|nr:putative metal-binding motif-containing protein [Deltaproteobacteria bacterium]